MARFGFCGLQARPFTRRFLQRKVGNSFFRGIFYLTRANGPKAVNAENTTKYDDFEGGRAVWHTVWM